MTIPTSLLNVEADELVALATKVRDWQEAKKLSDAELLRKFAGLGSDKTYRRIRANDLAELDLERQLANYRAVWALIESLSGRERQIEELYEDLSTVVQLKRAMLDIIDCTTIRRVILIEAESGLGKSSSLTLLQRKYGQRLLVTEASQVWGDNPNSLLGEVLDALGVKEKPISRDARFEMAVRKLNASPTTLAIDEAHHMGPACLNTCKSLINRTPIQLILPALPTLWRRLERAAYEEVKQLLGNRLAERIKVGGIRESDVKKILLRRCCVEDARSAAAVFKEAPARGNLSFVAAVCERLAEQEISGTPSHEDVIAALQAEIAKR